MTDKSEKFEIPPGISNLLMIKAYSTINAATGASVKTIDAAVNLSIMRSLGTGRKSMAGLLAKSKHDPRLIVRILTEFQAEIMDIRREQVREILKDIDCDDATLPTKPARKHGKRLDRNRKPRPS